MKSKVQCPHSFSRTCLAQEFGLVQGGRSWQPFSEGKNAHKSFRLAYICYFRDKCVVFARNCKFANSILMICNIYNKIVHLLPKKHCVWPKSPFLGQSLPKSVWIATNLNIVRKKAFFLSKSKLRRPFKPSHNFCHPDLYLWSKLQQGGKEARNSYICTACLWDSPSLLEVLPSYSQEPNPAFLTAPTPAIHVVN